LVPPDRQRTGVAGTSVRLLVLPLQGVAEHGVEEDAAVVGVGDDDGAVGTANGGPDDVGGGRRLETVRVDWVARVGNEVERGARDFVSSGELGPYATSFGLLGDVVVDGVVSETCVGPTAGIFVDHDPSSVRLVLPRVSRWIAEDA
jgi:hypothetical protein